MFLHGSLPDALPRIQTRQALVIIDLQNDFVSMNSKLPVRCSPDFPERIQKLVPAFRDVGDVIWVRSEYEASRLVNDDLGDGESVITDEQLPEEHRGPPKDDSADGITKQPYALTRPSARALKLFERAAARTLSQPRQESVEPEEESECFLTTSPNGREPTCCRPNSFGSQFAYQDPPLIDESVDTILTKSNYSAFKNTPLVSLMRGSLVTDIFLCGALSNISVYATALDAAKHGISMTLIEDCLGYRSRTRHDEAMRIMTDYMGADTISYEDLMGTIRQQVPQTIASSVPTLGGLVGRPAMSPVDTTSTEYPPLTKETTLGSTRLTEISLAAASAHSGVQSVLTSSDRKIESEVEAEHVNKRSRSGDHSPSSPLTESQMVELPTYDKVGAQPVQSSGPGPDAEGLRDDDGGNDDNCNDAGRSKDGLLQSIASVTRQMRRSSSSPSPPPTVGGPSTANSSRVPSTLKVRARQSKSKLASAPTGKSTMRRLGPGDRIGEGDSKIIHDLWPSVLKDDIFEMVKNEVRWEKMFHRGGEVPRLVAVQGDMDEKGNFPVYRHPSDSSPSLHPLTPYVAAIRDAVQNHLDHPVNHVLIQCYRGGHDYISEHSDKTLDIARGSSIVNVSLGAERVMTLRTKRPQLSETPESVVVSAEDPSRGRSEVDRPFVATTNLLSFSDPSKSPALTRRVQRFPLPHNSMFVLGPSTNARWLHSIRQDKRSPSELTAPELAFSGERISLTFRHVDTFLSPSSTHIWGQGGTSKTASDPRAVINGPSREAEAMIRAFGMENQQSTFDWDAVYGAGFDVLNTVSPKSRLPQLYLSGDRLSDLRVQLLLSEARVEYETVAQGETTQQTHDDRSLVFEDNDADRTKVESGIAILIYVETYYRQGGKFGTLHSRTETGAVISRIGQGREMSRLLGGAYQYADGKPTAVDAERGLELRRELDKWESYAERSVYIAGPTFSVADCAFWPMLDAVIRDERVWRTGQTWPALREYHELVRRRESVLRVIASQE